MSRRKHSSRLTTVLIALLVVGAYVWLERSRDTTFDSASGFDDSHVVRLFEAQRSGEVVEGAGAVLRLLADDDEGARHQRFILELHSGHTLLVSHNIDLAPRVAGLAVGDRVTFRGQYEWNAHGGVLHWTHHDPDGRRPGGWIRHAGADYR